jgi:hypothetical protein
MAIINVTPFVMKNAVITFVADDYSKAVSSATLTPSGGITTFKGLKTDAVYTFAQNVTWTLDLEYAQDWSTATSLSRYLFANQGQNVACTVNVNDVASGETSWAMTVSITAGAVGGAIDSVAVATVSLGVVGAPVPTTTP